MDPARLLDGLNDPQTRAVTTSSAPLCILAGAGSGKTRVLTRRIAYRVAAGTADASHVLALTFTRKAAGELSSRLRQLGLRESVAAGTFHAVAYAQLRSRWADRGVTPPTLLDRKVGFVARLLPRSSARQVEALDVVAEIEWASARMVTPDRYAEAAEAARRKPPMPPAQLARTYERYITAKREQRMVDFDDLLRLCRRAVVDDADFGAAQRWRFRHLFVDEYQDVNPLQQALLDAWLGDRPDLCVVGDPNQAIYAWNGADASYLTQFTQRHGRGEVVELVDNYRSSPQILAVANSVLAGSGAAQRAVARRGRGGRDPAVTGGAALGGGGLRAHRPDGPVPTVREHADDTAEAAAIARAVRDHHAPGVPWSAQAVLVRTNAQTAVLGEALRSAGIPFRVRGAGSLLDQPEVKALLGDLRRADASFEVALTDLQASVGRRAAAVADDDAPHLSDDRVANLEALVRLAHDYQALDPRPTVPGFLSWLSDATRGDVVDRHADAVELTTFHAAKGLEWSIVHLAGLEQGLVPIGHAATAADLAEERRLFYVAVTRAEQELHCTWAGRRTFGTRTVERQPSPYLDEVEVACSALRAGDVPADWATHLAALRAERESRGSASPARSSRSGASKSRRGGALSDLRPEDEALFEALKAWRAAQARAASMPAYVIFHDTTLASIASERPGSTAELLTVPGIGPAKAGRYGDDVLAVVAAGCFPLDDETAAGEGT